MKKTLSSLVLLSLLLVACGKSEKPLTDAEKIKQYSKVSQKTNKQVVDPLHGKQTGFWYGAILGSKDVSANGVGFLHKFEDGTLTATVNLNIQKAPAKRYHIAWLTNETESKTVLVGVLDSIVGDSRHSVSLSTKEDMTGLTKVLVTLESSSSPKKPGASKEAQGTLKEIQTTQEQP